MGTLAESLQTALALMASLDARLADIVLLSLQVSLSAVLLASAIGLPLGAAVAVGRFPGRQALTVIMNGLMGLPPVVVGLLVYLLLSRAGPLGPLGLLFTPTAMVIAQTVLIAPDHRGAGTADRRRRLARIRGAVALAGGGHEPVPR